MKNTPDAASPDRRAAPACRILLSNFEHAVPYGTSDTEIVAATRAQALGNGFACWLDHMHGTQDPPAPLPDESTILTYWPNNPYNARRARQRGISLAEYQAHCYGLIKESQRTLGDGFLWCIGWELFNSGHWCEADGSQPRFGSEAEAFAFYRRWVGTSLHTLHWRNSVKFGEDRFNTFPSAMELIAADGRRPDDFALALGDTHASRAHFAFDAFPEIKAFWWECGISAIGLQVGIPFVRGAARQYGKRWIADVSPFSYPYPIHDPEFYSDLGEWGGFEQGKGGHCRLNFPKYTREMVRLAGYSPDMLLRCWLTALLGGCDYLFQEASSLSHWVKVDGALRLTPVGEAARELADFNRRIGDRGRPHTPVTLLLDRYHGVEPTGELHPWSWLPVTPAARQIGAFFETTHPGHSAYPQAFPWTNEAEYGRLLRSGFDYRPYERSLLCPGRWGDLFDVRLSNAGAAALQESRLIVALGAHDAGRLDASLLEAWVGDGGTMVACAGQGLPLPFLPRSFGLREGERAGWAAAAGGELQSVAPYRVHALEVPDGWTTLQVTERGEPLLLRRPWHRGAVYFHAGDFGLSLDGARLAAPLVALLDELIPPLAPVSVEGPPVQWSVNRTTRGWLVLLINHGAEAWQGTVTLRDVAAAVRERWTEFTPAAEVTPAGTRVSLDVPAFAPRVLEFIESTP
jgi:hypothetical protein